MRKDVVMGIMLSLMAHVFAFSQPGQQVVPTPQQKAMYATSTKDLQEWMTFLTSEECRGRLTGDIGFQRAAKYAADLFKVWGLEPGGDNGTYFQNFDHPYVMPQEGGYFTLYLPQGDQWIAKQYDYTDHYCSQTGL